MTQMLNKAAFNRIDLTGKKYGDWEVISYSHTKSKQPFWNCVCICGNNKKVGSNSLRNGSKSCGHNKKNYKGVPRSGKSEFDIVMTNVKARYKCEAIKRGFTFDLTYDEFIKLTQLDCYYCNKSASESSYQTSPRNEIIRYNGVDRIDNSQGYNLKNCVTCCKQCNLLKRHIPFWMIEKLYILMQRVKNG